MLTPKQIRSIWEPFKTNRNTEGILLCGSYAYGKPTANSDLDLRVVTGDGTNFDGRGLRLFDVQIELLVNSPEAIRRYFEECILTGTPHAVHFWAHGKSLFDRRGLIATLQAEARVLWKRGPIEGVWRHTKTRIGGKADYIAPS